MPHDDDDDDDDNETTTKATHTDHRTHRLL
jgi:hypothetical protein